MSTNSKNVIMPSIPQPKSSPSLDAALREIRNIAGNRATGTAPTTSAAKRVAFRRSSTQSSSSPKNERTQGGAPPLAVSRTSTKKGAIRLSKLTASSFNATMPRESNKRLSAKSVPLAYKKIMI